jgi:hypothetical protein
MSARRQRHGPSGWLAERTYRSVLVHTTGDSTFQGVLMHTAEDGLVLGEATLHRGSQNPEVSLGGETFVPRAQVAFVQIMPAVTA